VESKSLPLAKKGADDTCPEHIRLLAKTETRQSYPIQEKPGRDMLAYFF